MPQNPARWRSSWSEMECIHGQSLIVCTMKSTTMSATAVHLDMMILFLQLRSNQLMKPLSSSRGLDLVQKGGRYAVDGRTLDNTDCGCSHVLRNLKASLWRQK